MSAGYVACIFDPVPRQWGLRGDPFLWRLLKERYLRTELPYSPEVLKEEILQTFVDLTGESPVPGKHYYVEQFAETHVGMSTGFLCGEFWQLKALPLLMERLERANRGEIDEEEKTMSANPYFDRSSLSVRVPSGRYKVMSDCELLKTRKGPRLYPAFPNI